MQENIKDRKKNNIIIFGIEEIEGENLYGTILEFFNTTLQTEVSKSEINHLYRFGRQNTNRPIVVKFVNLHEKIEILKSGNLLQGSNISIANDLIKEDRETQKILTRHFKEAKSQNLETKILNNKLIINGDIYTAKDLLSLEKEQLHSTSIENINSEPPVNRNRVEN